MAVGVPVGKGIAEATVYLGGMSFHLTGPLTRLDEVAVGEGKPGLSVSWRKAK